MVLACLNLLGVLCCVSSVFLVKLSGQVTTHWRLVANDMRFGTRVLRVHTLARAGMGQGFHSAIWVNLVRGLELRFSYTLRSTGGVQHSCAEVRPLRARNERERDCRREGERERGREREG